VPRQHNRGQATVSPGSVTVSADTTVFSANSAIALNQEIFTPATER